MTEQIKREFITKQGEVIMALTDILMELPEGYKLMSVSELCAKLKAGVGTVQSALRTLTDAGIIELSSHGHQGTYITAIDRVLLWKFGRQPMICGSMPLPYTLRFQGLATALYSVFEEHEIQFSIAYSRGGRVRVKRLLSGKTDFSICSKLTANEAMKENKNVRILVDFGPGSFVSDSRVVFAHPGYKRIEDGMRIGIDASSYDHPALNYAACANKDVTFVPLNYTEIFAKLSAKEIDATIWSKDEIDEKYPGFHWQPIEEGNTALYRTALDSENATLIALEENISNNILIQELVKPAHTAAIQQEVIDRKRTPSY